MSKPRAAPPNLAQSINEALALHRQGRLAEAEKIYARVLKARPDHFDALNLLGVLKQQRGKAGEAYRLLAAALEIDPGSVDALSNLGMALHALARDDEALAMLDRALALSPRHLEALNNRGNALLALDRPQDALQSFDRVLALDPRHLEARVNRGNALAMLERLSDAIADYDAALALYPGHAGASFNRGNALLRSARDADAVAAFERTLSIDPHNAEAWNNRGIALRALNRQHDALASYARALALRKDYAEAHLNEAHALLAIIARKTILIHAEQGFGDTVQFVRYAPLLARTGAKVVLEVPPPLAPLLASTAGVDAVIASGAALPAFDVHCPLPSLPLAFKTELATIPAEVPYVRADDERIAKWRSRLARLRAPRVALAWSGRASHANDRNRSIALARLEPLLAIEGISFVSVQRDVRDGDADTLARHPRLAHLGEDLADFADTAAVLALVDLLVSVDTSVAHVAGAMGRPLWIALPFGPDWRWLADREDSPWYPTAKLFRQPAAGDGGAHCRRGRANGGRTRARLNAANARARETCRGSTGATRARAAFLRISAPPASCAPRAAPPRSRLATSRRRFRCDGAPPSHCRASPRY